MILKETLVKINNPRTFSWSRVYNSILEKLDFKKQFYIVKLNLIENTPSLLTFYILYIDNPRFKPFLDFPFKPNIITHKKNNRDIFSMIIPTGIGAHFGGYAGDANYIAHELSKKNKHFLTNPNVVNGSVLSDVPTNLIYLEGFLLDQFLLGNIKIIPSMKNKIGVIFDKGIGNKKLNYEINVLNACKIFYGANIQCYTITDKPLKIKTRINKYGFSTGEILNLESLIKAAIKLKKKGITAIAICSLIPDSNLNKKYSSGLGIDPIGGIEAIISHTVSAFTGIPSANAPVLLGDISEDYKNISPLSAGEYIADTFLPSVISGLRYAPRILKCNSKNKNAKKCSHISKLVLPWNAFGSTGAMFQCEKNKNVYLVKKNTTELKTNPTNINLDFKHRNNYLEFLGSNKKNINKEMFSRPIKKISRYQSAFSAEN